MLRSVVAFAFVLLLALALVGCANVAPYERGKLAHPTMTTADLAGPGESHVRAVHEGAIGGGFEVGGGCGCN
jgi:PBP1b-binding outer membrane lipoprotein LpoB